jgi:hypothetical protein
MDMTTSSLKAVPPPTRLIYLFVGFVLLVAIIMGAGWLINVQETNTYWVRHTLEVQKSIGRTFSLLQDAETGQRGYLLTGERVISIRLPRPTQRSIRNSNASTVSLRITLPNKTTQ